MMFDISRRLSFPAFASAMMWCLFADAAQSQTIDLGSNRQLFVDEHLIAKAENVELKLHEPFKQPLAKSPLPDMFYFTVILDEDDTGPIYKAYWREINPDYTGEKYSGSNHELLRYAESRDGHEWTFPKLGLHEVKGSKQNNVLMVNMPAMLHSFTPFLDTRPGADPAERYKALTGHPGLGDKSELRGKELEGRGLFLFTSPDGIHWKKKEEVIPYQPGWAHAFDSQNCGFWSEAEQLYVCYIRTWTEREDASRLRAISRVTSVDGHTWTKPVLVDANLPGEHLYTSQTHPYFRAPQIYIALPSRYIAGRVGDQKTGDAMLGSTDILFMTSRAGSTRFDRFSKEAYIRLGLAGDRWANRANYVALNILPTSPNEMSIYHRSGHRYTLRTDGFMSINAGFEQGQVTTKPFTFEGSELEINFSTSAGGSLQIELLDAQGQPIPGFALDDAPLLVGDKIEQVVQWGQALDDLRGRTVRLRFVMRECDIYSFRFR